MMKKLLTLMLAAGAICQTGLVCAADPEPYNSIKLVPHEPYFLENPYILSEKVNSQPDAVFVDVGSKEGGAARWVAANTSDSVKVYSICRWDEAKYAFQKFLSNVRQENLASRVIPIRMKSQEAAVGLQLTADCIYLESEEVTDLYGNIKMWSSHLGETGSIIGNRFDLSEVSIAVVEAAAELGMDLQINGHTWVLQRG